MKLSYSQIVLVLHIFQFECKKLIIQESLKISFLTTKDETEDNNSKIVVQMK